MIRRILEIASDGRRLSLDRGFIVISDDNQEVGRTPIDDVEALIVSAHAATCTTRLISALAERGVPLVICGSRYTPIAKKPPKSGASLELVLAKETVRSNRNAVANDRELLAVLAKETVRSNRNLARNWGSAGRF